MDSLNNEIYLAFNRFLKLLHSQYGDPERPLEISFNPNTAIIMDDVINNFSMPSFTMNSPRIDLFKGCTMNGVKLGVFMSQKELDHLYDSIKRFSEQVKEE